MHTNTDNPIIIASIRIHYNVGKGLKVAINKTSEMFSKEFKTVNPNIVLLEDYQKMAQRIACRCSKCGFPGNGEWKPLPKALLAPDACPVCAGRQLGGFYKGFNDLETWCRENDRTDILDDWDYVENEKDESTPNTPGEIARSNPRIRCHWRCHICGMPWLTTPNKRTSPDKKTGAPTSCPHCSKSGTSFSELALDYYFGKYFPDIIIRSRVQIGRELDIFLPSERMAIEFDGYFYHKNKLVADNEKDRLCKDNGILLFRLRDSRLPKTESATIVDCGGIQEANFESSVIQLLELCGVKQLSDVNIKRDYGEIITNYKKAVMEHSLKAEYPEIADEWHPTKNGDLRPEYFTPGEDYYAWWKCSKCGHSWQAHIYSRTGGKKQGCPKCKLKQQGQTYRQNRARKMNLEQWCNANSMSELLLEWDYEANREDPKCPDTPKDCPFGSPNDVHWVCSRCRHKWLASPATRRSGKGVCRKCIDRLFIPGQNDLITWCILNEKTNILDDWDYEANLADPECPDKPEDVRYNQSVSVHWKCHVCGYEWPTRVRDRTKSGKACKKCSYKTRHQKKVRNIDTGEVFDSIKDAELKYSGKVGTNICQCLKGVQKTAYKCHWEYVED